MLYDGIKVIVENVNPTDVDIPYYVNKIRRRAKGKELQRLSIVVYPEDLVLRYTFKNYPFERIWRLSTDSGIRKSAI